MLLSGGERRVFGPDKQQPDGKQGACRTQQATGMLNDEYQKLAAQ